jgi:hypothetical protein
MRRLVFVLVMLAGLTAFHAVRTSSLPATIRTGVDVRHEEGRWRGVLCNQREESRRDDRRHRRQR